MSGDVSDAFDDNQQKVFVLSLHRTATRSVHSLLRTVGYNSLHWPTRDGKRDIRAEVTGHETDLEFVWQSLLPLLGRYNAFSDVPFPVLFRQAARDFPEAKFLLLSRNPETWLNSVRSHVGSGNFKPFERIQYWQYFPECPKRLSQIPENGLLELQQRHIDAVKSTIDSDEKLLVTELERDDVGESICEFLGREQKVKLPRVSAAKSFNIRRAVSKILRHF